MFNTYLFSSIDHAKSAISYKFLISELITIRPHIIFGYIAAIIPLIISTYPAISCADVRVVIEY